jgi:hypothetical protein
MENHNILLDELLNKFINDYESCDICNYNGFTVDCGDMGDFCYKCLNFDNCITYDILNNYISKCYK